MDVQRRISTSNRLRFGLKTAWPRLAVAGALAALPLAGLATDIHLLAAGPSPLRNPLKGYAAYSDTGSHHYAPAAMAYVSASWRDLEPTPGKYAFATWEANSWNTPLAKGKPVVMRVFLDYPAQPIAVPQWLIDSGLKMTKYDEFGGGFSPDYESPKLQAALWRLIKALGARYDGNSRVAYVQLGILGHWGEWHTYPRAELFATDATQRKVIAALRTAFPHKPLMARNASYASCQLPWLGFHDDMIPDDTLGSDAWNFVPTMRTGGVAENWKVAPTGGEMVPGAAKTYLGAKWSQLVEAVKAAHFTWIGPYCPALEESSDPVFQSRANQLIQMLGYDYRLLKIDSPAGVKKGTSFAVTLDGQNQGVAPFYAPWSVELALVDAQNRVAQRIPLKDDLRRWLPGAFRIQSSLTANVPPGRYRLAIGILDPSTGKPAISFANSADQVSDYTVLAPLTVTADGQ